VRGHNRTLQQHRTRAGLWGHRQNATKVKARRMTLHMAARHQNLGTSQDSVRNGGSLPGLGKMVEWPLVLPSRQEGNRRWGKRGRGWFVLGFLLLFIIHSLFYVDNQVNGKTQALERFWALFQITSYFVRVCVCVCVCKTKKTTSRVQT